jgi:hypothetical protein
MQISSDLLARAEDSVAAPRSCSSSAARLKQRLDVRDELLERGASGPVDKVRVREDLARCGDLRPDRGLVDVVAHGLFRSLDALQGSRGMTRRRVWRDTPPSFGPQAPKKQERRRFARQTGPGRYDAAMTVGVIPDSWVGVRMFSGAHLDALGWGKTVLPSTEEPAEAPARRWSIVHGERNRQRTVAPRFRRFDIPPSAAKVDDVARL